MHPKLAPMMNLFHGYENAYGTYRLTGEIDERGKKEGVAEFIKRPLPTSAWNDHLSGRVGLGIIPINEDSRVKFGAIDVDIYDLNIVGLNDKIVKNNLPLVTCRTKSGGAHLYCFLHDWVPAKLMRRKLREWAAFLGYGNSEIYPKQIQMMVDRGDMGSWINMPYFDESDTKRYALNKWSKPLDLDGFIRYAEERRIDGETLADFTLETPEILEGGPPCLQTLVHQGFPEGTRNNGLFALGVYAKKAYPDDWQSMVDEYNSQYLNPPLSSSEVEAVKKSLDRRDYNYRCSEQPIVRHCNSVKCRACKFGVATKGDIPLLSSLTIINTDPVIYFLDVEEGGRIYLTAEELQNPRLFQRVCMQRLKRMPPVPKAETWRDIIAPLFEKATVIDVPEDVTPEGQLISHLEDFCTSRLRVENKEGLLTGKVFLEDGYYLFRSKDFFKYLDAQKFQYKPGWVYRVFRDRKIDHASTTIDGKCVQYWAVEEFDSNDSPLPIPLKRKKDPF